MCSKSVDVTSGVPQSTVLGPLMFLLFINGMQGDLVYTLRLFADDALLYHKITHNDDTLALQRDLDKLGLWADRWQMLFNPSKCYKMSVFPIFGLPSERRKSHRLQIFHKSVYNDIPWLFRLIINCLLGKLEITRRIHLFNHLYIMITISIVSSREL